MDKTKELVVTVRLPAGDVVKIEELKSSGDRRAISEQEFAELAAHGEEESLIAALEEAYAAGAADAGESDAPDETNVRILWDAAARMRLRSTVRRLVLARALTRMAAADSETPKPKTTPRPTPAKKGAAHARGSHTEH
jgi:hypothetical protein